jgi:hypothetical protein
LNTGSEEEFTQFKMGIEILVLRCLSSYNDITALAWKRGKKSMVLDFGGK